MRALLLVFFENVFNGAAGSPSGLQLFCRRRYVGLSLQKGSERVLDQSPMDAHIGDGSWHHPILLKQLVHGGSYGGEIVLPDEALLRGFND